MSRARSRKAGPLQAIAENGAIIDGGNQLASDIMRVMGELESNVEQRLSMIHSAAEDAILALKNESKRLLVTLPKKMRTMPLKKFQEEYPSDFQSGALEEIRERYAAMAEAAKQAPLTTRGKRGAEPPTVMRTVRAKRTQDPLQMKQPRVFARQLGPSSSSLAPVPEAENVVARNEEEEKEEEDENDAVAPLNGNLPAPPVPRQTFNGLPLQTPMPFAGAAVPVPVTMLAQKRAGARTKAVAAPDAAIITTADGKQWALGKEGIASIPDSHKAEVEELLSAQFSFLAAALGKTVFEGRGRKRR